MSTDLRHWYRADVTMMSILDPGTDAETILITLTNRPSDWALSLPPDVPVEHPLLLDISGLSFTIGQDGFATQSDGAIVINDEAGSFGAERRFSDLLERYTPIQQTIEIYDALGEINTDPAWSAGWKGTCTNISAGGETLTLSIDWTAARVGYLNAKINNSVFTMAPASSIGRSLAHIFGSRDGGIQV